MLPQKYRLKNKNAFKATYRINNVKRLNGITLFIGKENKSDNPAKIGFVVSKKIHKRAVKRNRIKRLMRESCRLLIKENKIPSKYISLIFVASARCLDKNFNDIYPCISKLVEKL